MTKKLLFFIFFIQFFYLSSTLANSAKVFTLKIKKGDTVSQDISVMPGFAVIIEFPSEIVAPVAIPDRNSFACERKVPAYNSILCRPLTGENIATTAIITTENNEFILNLNVTNTKENTYDKYVFIDPTQTKSEQDVTKSEIQDNLLNILLKDFSYEPCSSKTANNYLQLNCLEKIQIGTDSYLKFSILNVGSSAIEIIKCGTIVQTLGGFTGLSLKSEVPQDTEYLLSQKNIHHGEKIFGVLKIPNLGVSSSQRLILHIYTNIGKDADIVLTKL